MSAGDPASRWASFSAQPGRDDRPVDWYELFFDLVFVVVIAVSAESLEADPGLRAVGVFVLLFFPLWWAWINLMVTNNLYGRRFPAMGALIVAAMPGPAAMAIAMAGGIEQYGWLYAVGAAWVRLVLLAMWLFPFATRAVSVSAWRPLGYNLATAVLWLGSIFLESPYRYLLWVAAVVVEMLLLLLRRGFAVEVYEQASISHLLERIGLFVVIVIGEAVYLSVTVLAGRPTIGGAASAMFGFVSCALLARAFFRWAVPTTESGLASARNARSYGAMRDVVMYFPFMTVSALTLIAASIGIAVADAGVPLATSARWLLGAGVAGFYFSNTLIGLRLGRRTSRVALLFALGTSLPAMACLLSGELPAWATLGFVTLALFLLDALSSLLNARWKQPG